MIYAAAMMVLLPPIWWLGRLPEDFPPPGRASGAKQAAGPPIPLSALLQNRSFWISSIVTGIMTGANTGVMVSLVNFATSHGLTTSQGSLLLSIIRLLAVLGKVVTGFGIGRINRVNAMGLGIGFEMSGMILFPLATGHGSMMALAALFGFGVGAMLPVWWAGLANLFGLSNYGRALGWSRTIMTPIALLFPLTAGTTCFSLVRKHSIKSERSRGSLQLDAIADTLSQNQAGKSLRREMGRP